jgi:hypothetical protein
VLKEESNRDNSPATFAIPNVAYLEATYGTIFPGATCAASDAMTTIAPRPKLRVVPFRGLVYVRGSCLAMAVHTARRTSIVPRALTDIVRSKSLMGRSLTFVQEVLRIWYVHSVR